MPHTLYDSTAIRSLFDEMSATYGVVNLIASFGFAARWRHLVVKGLPVAPSAHIVDLMSGMSELCRSVDRHVPTPARLTAVDISPQMIRRARKEWPFPMEVLLADVLEWDFAFGSADAVISSFGLKTFDRDQQELLAERVARLLRPGGVFSFIEISDPGGWFLRPLYLFYLERVVPYIGRIFLGNPANYRLLGIYTRAFGDCRHFAGCLRRQGLQVTECAYFFGCATSVRGCKPGLGKSSLSEDCEGQRHSETENDAAQIHPCVNFQFALPRTTWRSHTTRCPAIRFWTTVWVVML